MAYSLSVAFTAVLDDGSGGQQTFSVSPGAVLPTKPAFCGSGTATTTPTAISYGSVTTPKALVIVNDGANEITVDVGTDTHVIGVTGSTTKLPFLVLPTLASAPSVSTASSTSAYRTFIVE